MENLKEIRKHYYWPNLQNHLNKFINDYRICLEAKNENPLTTFTLTR